MVFQKLVGNTRNQCQVNDRKLAFPVLLPAVCPPCATVCPRRATLCPRRSTLCLSLTGLCSVWPWLCSLCTSTAPGERHPGGSVMAVMLVPPTPPLTFAPAHTC